VRRSDDLAVAELVLDEFADDRVVERLGEALGRFGERDLDALMEIARGDEILVPSNSMPPSRSAMTFVYFAISRFADSRSLAVASKARGNSAVSLMDVRDDSLGITDSPLVVLGGCCFDGLRDR